MSRSAQILTGTVVLLIAELAAWALLRFQWSTAAVLFPPCALPWVLLLPGLSRGNRRSALWAVLLVSPYLAYGLMEILANPGARSLAAAQVLLSFAVFVAAIAHLRLSRPTA
jgi:uncharacterized membrane protein